MQLKYVFIWFPRLVDIIDSQKSFEKGYGRNIMYAEIELPQDVFLKIDKILFHELGVVLLFEEIYHSGEGWRDWLLNFRTHK